MLTLVDTNVLLRAAEPSHNQHGLAVMALRLLRQSGDTLCIVPQVLYELWVVATRPVEQNGLGMTSAEADTELSRVGPPLFRLYRDERAIYDIWRPLVLSHNVSGKSAHDARLVAAMHRHGISRILTFNGNDFQKYPEVEIISPRSVATT